jgi:hypothetical protein
MPRKKKKDFLLYVEGPTEAIYFESLKQLMIFRNSAYKLDVVTCSGINNLLKTALNPTQYERKRMKVAEKVGFIFDKDQITVEQFQKMMALDYLIGFSNPQFEIWLIAHFENLKAGYSDVMKSLDNFLPGYRKAEYRISDLAKDYEIAISNTRHCDLAKFDELSTSVASVISAILEGECHD